MKLVVAAAALVAIGAPVRADDGGFLHRFLADAQARIAAATPKLVPPVKVELKWKLGKLGSLDLGAPLVALVGADLDGDGKGELYAVTSHDVIAIGLADKRVKELGRVAFAGAPAVPAPRDVVGTAVVDAGALVANVSSWARGLRVRWRAKVLVGDPGDADFVPCPGEHAHLAAGRNYFGDPASATYATRCRSDLVDGDGHPLHARATLALPAKLGVDVERCAAGGGGCQAAGHYEYGEVGVAFEIADVDRDGTPEVVYAGAGAPGDADYLKVVSVGGDPKKPRFKKPFTAGGVAAVAVTDVDGDGVEDVIAAVRLVGATRVDLWRLE